MAVLLAMAMPAPAAQPARNVLVLYGFPRLQPVNVEGDRGFHAAIRTSVDHPVLVFDESLDSPRFGGPGYESTVITYLRQKYAARPPDVLVAVGEASLRFFLDFRSELFTNVPIVYGGVGEDLLRTLSPLPADVVGAPTAWDFCPTIDLAFRWHPHARRLVAVTGSSQVDRRWEAQLRADIPRLKARATVEVLAGMPMAAVLQRVAALGRDAVVWTPGFFSDNTGRSFVPRDTVAAIAGTSSVPVYVPFESLVVAGVVGGYSPSAAAMGRQVAEIVNELLAGTPPAALHLPQPLPQTLVVDWRQIRRWGISTSAIPSDAVVLSKPPPLLKAYPNDVLVAVLVGLLQTSLIGWLVAERRRRRRAEAFQDVQRRELAHVSRLAVAGELTASIAHEINQPLGAILSNADAASLILESGDDRRKEIRAILADIRRDDRRASEVVRQLRGLLAKHEIEPRPFDLNDVVHDVELLLAGEAERRRVRLRTRPAPGKAPVVGDPVQIQQVLINLVLNAIDAVQEMPDERRTIAVAVAGDDGWVNVVVKDDGHGVALPDLPRLFEPFFTTKRSGMGLGLSISRTLVESHGGRIWAENDPHGGAVFHIEFPAASERGAASAERP